MVIRKLVLAAIGLFTVLTVPAAAQDDEAFCGVTDASTLEEVASQLEGKWISEAKAGYVVMGPMVMPHPAAPAPKTGRLEMRDGRLTIVPDNPEGIDLSLDWETGVDWSFGKQPSLPEGNDATNVPELDIDDDELAVVAGCPVNELPRLVGVDSLMVEGTSMTYTLRLIVVDPDLIYGFQQVHGIAGGHSIVERRPIVMHS
ncbi:hypothetical protein [Halomonas daqiaonensis]|uniref:Uncharacterized protein n=1 Tax=Halomonas daqiaonensis TaxID=650850 RepID=A0A1H7QPU5_9GAMM|nr:hypothetical protein [Halomonas daqiaonensis]SEL49943.1 hypothetical protein SAMN04488129_11119 [Halomonas daqiaonensis]